MQPWCLDVMLSSWQPLSSRVSSNKTWARITPGTHALAKVPYQVTFHIHGYLWIWHLVFMDIHGYLEHIHGYLWIVHRAYAFKLTKSGLVVHILLVRHRGSSLVGVHRWNPSRSRSSFGIQHVFLLKDITVLLEVLKSCFNKLRINF